MKLLIAASEPMEFRGLLARATNVHRFTADAGWSRSARLGPHELLLVANGSGCSPAGAAVDSALSVFRPDALASTGLCGAVAPGLRPAQIVVATEVAFGEDRYPTVPVHSALPYERGLVRTIDHIAQTVEEKRFWHSTGAIAVEMEAAAVAKRACELGLPFFCIKAVSDLADETLANDLNAALRVDGHFDTIKILGSTLRHPLVRVPELLRLGRRSARAANYLGDFFADCRF
jgi:adenosylhomocysteine nucleosidase